MIITAKNIETLLADKHWNFKKRFEEYQNVITDDEINSIRCSGKKLTALAEIIQAIKNKGSK